MSRYPWIVVGALLFVGGTISACSSDTETWQPPTQPQGTPGITVTPTSGLTTSETGDSAKFAIRLDAQPTSDVTIALSSSDTSEGTVSPASVTFTLDNWAAPQQVTVKGVDDSIADGNIAYKIVTAPAKSADARYDKMNAVDVAVTNTDNETAGITVTPTSGLKTTESGGTDQFTVVLNAEPTADVTIPLSSDDTTEGTVSVGQLVFTTANWKSPQTVTVTGVDDAEDDGDQPYTIVTGPALSSDTSYDGIDADDVDVSNIDNDIAGVTVAPTTGLTTTEAGGTATFTIVLNAAPTADVTIGLSSSDETEGTMSPASVMFTVQNWNAPQTVTVTGVDDPVRDGDQPYTIVTAPAVSTDSGYSGVNVDDVELTNTDDETAGVTVEPTTGLTTTEAGGTAEFTIVLNSEPIADVTIALTSSDTGEGTVSPASVTFTSANWNAPQTATVTGVDDALADGNQPYRIETAAAVSTGSDYNGLDPDDVEVTNTDNDSPGITVNPTSGLTTTEGGGTATFTVVLNSQPSADVIVTASSSDPSEGTASPASLLFTTANWNAPQTVTVTGVDDPVADGNQPYQVVLASAVSSDPGYDGIGASDVSVTNIDNDSAGITVDPTTGLVTTESGGTDTFTIALNSAPTADVTIALSSSDESEGTVSPRSVTFTPANWKAPQTVTVTGVDDQLADGNQPYSIVTAPAVSADTQYGGVDAPNVEVSNTDNDSAGITVDPTTGLVTTEGGGTATFRMVLNTQPTANVTIALSSSDTTEG
ncbi:MAG: hypothetical protein MUF54_06585, partial [Polyangiaceae bacterium]|nr:hypothetical protein [Polyangiaceae bacterium]